MAIDSSQILSVQQSLRAIGMNVGAQDGVPDEAFKQGVLDSLSLLYQSLTKDPTAKITDFSPATRQKLETEIKTFMASKDYQQLDALSRGDMADPALDLGPLDQIIAKGIAKAGPKGIQLIVEQLGSEQAQLSYKYINPDAPLGKRVPKPAGVRENTPGMLAVLKNSGKIFDAIDGVYNAPQVSPGSSPTQVAGATPPAAKPPADLTNTFTVLAPGNPPAKIELTSNAVLPTPSPTPGSTQTSAIPVASGLTTAEAIENVENVLAVIAGKLNAQAGKMENIMGVTFSVEEPGEAGGTFDATSQKSLQSVLWALRGPKGVDMPVDPKDPEDYLWSYSPSVGAEIKRKLPRLLEKLDEKDRKGMEAFIKGNDFFNSLNKLHDEGLLGERVQVAENPVQVSGWLKGLLGSILPAIIGMLKKFMPDIENMANDLLGQKAGVSLADLAPDHFSPQRKSGTDTGPGTSSNPTMVAGNGAGAAPTKPAAKTAPGTVGITTLGATTAGAQQQTTTTASTTTPSPAITPAPGTPGSIDPLTGKKTVSLDSGSILKGKFDDVAPVFTIGAPVVEIASTEPAHPRGQEFRDNGFNISEWLNKPADPKLSPALNADLTLIS